MHPSNEKASPWPAALDALIAAPAHHKLLLENARVRVLETRIAPGQTVPLHTHCWPSVLHVLRWSDVVRRDAHGTITLDTRGQPPPPAILWSDALPPHTLENVGQAELHIISVEVKGVS
jgi:hypothetical protein